MSDPLRIALVVEGPTDKIVIDAIIRSILTDRSFILTQLHPEGSLVFGPLGSGWAGVYRWCKNAAKRGHGHLSDDALLFAAFDLLIIHLDADVAGMRYEENSITPDRLDGKLPCEQQCPPAAATTNKLRKVVLSWCGEKSVPDRTVICMPSKNTEAWVLATLYPSDQAMQGEIECFHNPEMRLGQQKKRARIRKCQHDYEEKAKFFIDAWPRLFKHEKLGEAKRFHEECTKALHRNRQN